ncbi:PucR family transcriptional regulator ligand-binding domain-containing protein (plasmid) [Streptomyces sp. NBC_01717]|nr:hypothetical protein [Streptomyces sp. NBC_01717]
MNSARVPFRWLVDCHDLGLTVLTGHDNLERQVQWAHSIEFADPTS